MSNPTEIPKSESFILSNKVVINCEASDSTSFKWEVFRINENSQEPVPVRGNTAPNFLVPPRTLDYGLYKIKATVFMLGIEDVYGSDTAYIKIVSTPFLDVKIVGDIRIRLGIDKNVSIIRLLADLYL